MKKLISMFLAVAILVSVSTVAFAAEKPTAQKIIDLLDHTFSDIEKEFGKCTGVYYGYEGGDLYYFNCNKGEVLFGFPMDLMGFQKYNSYPFGVKIDANDKCFSLPKTGERSSSVMITAETLFDNIDWSNSISYTELSDMLHIPIDPPGVNEMDGGYAVWLTVKNAWLSINCIDEKGTIDGECGVSVHYQKNNNCTYDFASVADITPAPPVQNETTSFGSAVSEWAKEEVEEAYDKGLVPEVLVGKDLTEKVDRAEFASIAVMLYENLSGEKSAAAKNPFGDIAENPCKDDILKAYALDITAGTSKTTFEPDADITREQMATMLTRAYKKSEFDNWSLANDGDYPLNFIGVQKFADDDEISDFARESVYFMVRWNVINGVGDNKFAPKENGSLGEAYGYATREQALCIALRSAKYLK